MNVEIPAELAEALAEQARAREAFKYAEEAQKAAFERYVAADRAAADAWGEFRNNLTRKALKLAQPAGEEGR